MPCGIERIHPQYQEKLYDEILPLARFGSVQLVVTNTPGTLLAQKIKAILNRQDLQPRDFYDVVWFLSQNIEPDNKFLDKADIGKIVKIYQERLIPQMANFRARLKPFLINEKKISYLNIFKKVAENRYLKK